MGDPKCFSANAVVMFRLSPPSPEGAYSWRRPGGDQEDTRSIGSEGRIGGAVSIAFMSGAAGA